MALRKLWNSLCGRSEPSATNAQASPTSSKTDQTKRAGKSRSKRSSDTAKNPTSNSDSALVATSKATPAKTVTKSRGVFSMLSRGEHDGLIRLIKKHHPTSVLEIGLGDGSRSPAILTAMSEQVPDTSQLKFAVIDQFEMGGGQVSLRDYHAQLAGLPMRPAIIPETRERGLLSVAYRLGTFDMVVVDPSVDASQVTELCQPLSKVTHPGSVVVQQIDGKWMSASHATNATRRAA